jgi:CRP/FNR family transcriptional regulator, cyclic AMP receptor protein
MNVVELIGYLASALVLATFCMRGMVALRIVAIASNTAFIAYGVLAEIGPILLLHLVLLPTNFWRLWQLQPPKRTGSSRAAATRPRSPRTGRRTPG